MMHKVTMISSDIVLKMVKMHKKCMQTGQIMLKCEL